MIIHMHNFKKRLCKSAPKINVRSEWDFGQLDRCLHESQMLVHYLLKPLLFSNNKIAQLLYSKSQAEVKILLQKAQLLNLSYYMQSEESKCKRNGLSCSKQSSRYCKQQ